MLTRRMRLEPLMPSHAALLFDGLQDSRLYEYISDLPPPSVEALHRRYTALASRRSPDGTEEWLNWALWSLEDGAFAGYVQATIRADRSADIAYVLFPERWGRGLAREAVAALLAELRERHAVRVARASVHTGNVRSVRLLLALGFVLVSVTREAEVIRGQLTDEATFERRSGMESDAPIGA